MSLGKYTTAIASVITALSAASTSFASLTIVPNSGATQVGNLITNGSFENTSGGGPTGNGFANSVYWANGTTLTPYGSPAAWITGGNTNSYANWGNDGGVPNRMVGSDPIPDGNYALYFGNGTGVFSSLAPNYNMTTGEVTFAGTPTFTPKPTYPTAVTLTQTIPTVANPAPQYAMNFWASGEASGLNSDPTSQYLGIFGLQLTNVLPGDPVLYFAVPSAPDNALGASFVYDFFFTPINPLNNVKVTFINYGHFNNVPYGLNATTELVLDDVRVNAILPEPATLGLLGLGAAGLLRRKRKM